MSDSLDFLMADPAGTGADRSGGVEAACSAGLITDVESLRSFLYGRLWTAGAMGAFGAAVVCARVRTTHSLDSLFRSAEAEMDARIPSPAARLASRVQGGELLRQALKTVESEILDTLVRATISSQHRPHHPVAIGAVAAAARATPEKAAAAAASASFSGAATSAEKLLGLSPMAVAALSAELAPEVGRLAREAGAACLRSLSEMPSFAAPALEYLAEAHAAGAERSFAS